MTTEPTYNNVYALRDMFRIAGGKADEYNRYETPGTYFFRIFFYFDNRCYSGGDGINASNLLSTDIDTRLMNIDPAPRSTSTMEEHTFANSALNYLLINNEYERAELLLQFISLLSNINTYSPWYFSEIGGLAEAIDRKEFGDEGFKIEDSRRELTIKCLPDAMDNRIGTLLDLYREICYSYALKKEIVPANLRKFDMGIYLFSTPLYGLHRHKTETTEDFAKFDLDWKQGEYCTSSKYFEFHNCEINLNSPKSAYDNLTNADGSQMNYSIGIKYDSCYERRYNEFMMREIGDMVFSDLKQSMSGTSLRSKVQGDIPAANISAPSSIITAQAAHQAQLNNRETIEVYETVPKLDKTEIFPSPIQSASDIIANNIQGAISGALKPAKSAVSELWLGNIYYDNGIDESLTRAEKAIEGIKSGSLVRSAIAGLFD